MKPLVAIVGRPNVGKSTLFNRLTGRRTAVVQDEPGVTRDRHYGDCEWEGRRFTVIDTGGFVPGEKDVLLAEVREQAQLAVEEADVILLVCDARTGLVTADREVGTYLRKSGKPVLVVANKVDSDRPGAEAAGGDFFKLGLGDVLTVSAEHNLGIPGLFDAVKERLPPAAPDELEDAPPDDGAIRVAIVGRPNVGKSTLVNALLKKKRMVASDVPGTTRDAVDTRMEYDGRTVILTDTAGIRRKKNVSQRVEKYTAVAALRVMERCDVAVLVMDATEPAVDQDAKLAGIAEDYGRALIIVVNKWDLVGADAAKQEKFREDLKYKFKFVAYAPIVFTSALTGSKVNKILELAAQLAEQFRFRAPTPQLNRLLDDVISQAPMPIISGRHLRIYYIAQVGVSPPTFALTCNSPEGVPGMYKRYLTNQLRKTFDLKVPMRLLFRERPGQAKRAARKRPQPEGKKRRPSSKDR